MRQISKQLIEQHGSSVIAETRTFNLTLCGTRGAVNVLYEPVHRRVSLFDATPADIRANPALASAIRHADWCDLYSKVVVYARPGQEGWRELGLRLEAEIRGYFSNGDNAELWAAYPLPVHVRDARRRMADTVLNLARAKEQTEPSLRPGFSIVRATPADAPAIAALLAGSSQGVTPERIAAAIRDGSATYHLARVPYGPAVACLSATPRGKAVEISACSTRSDQRHRGLMSCLVRAAEAHARQAGATHAYTLARACDLGLNCVFSKLGYEYTGRLLNDGRTNEGFESNNVWCRSLCGTTSNPDEFLMPVGERFTPLLGRQG
jgi:putative beta-lysine N-acetyltransferase